MFKSNMLDVYCMYELVVTLYLGCKHFRLLGIKTTGTIAMIILRWCWWTSHDYEKNAAILSWLILNWNSLNCNWVVIDLSWDLKCVELDIKGCLELLERVCIDLPKIVVLSDRYYKFDLLYSDYFNCYSESKLINR